MQTQGIAPMILPAHILAGGLALVVGYVALYATKGATLQESQRIDAVAALSVRLRVRHNFRGIAGASTRQATAIEARAFL